VQSLRRSKAGPGFESQAQHDRADRPGERRKAMPNTDAKIVAAMAVGVVIAIVIILTGSMPDIG
jgi:capsular polysaccharide biosynthesis protein